MEAYPRKREILRSYPAANAPQISEPMQAMATQGSQKLDRPKRAVFRSLAKANKTAILTGRRKKAITGVGLPSYTSTAHRCAGKAESLKKRPRRINAKPVLLVIILRLVCASRMSRRSKNIAVPAVEYRRKTPKMIRPALIALR